MSYNLVVGNDIESNYELMFTVLSMQGVWELLQRVTILGFIA